MGYFLTHLMFLDKITEIPLYELDGQELRAKCRTAGPYTILTLVQYNLSLVSDRVPTKVFLECGLDFDRFPPPRMLGMTVRRTHPASVRIGVAPLTPWRSGSTSGAHR